MEAVVLTMLEQWGALGDALEPLDRIAENGSPYLEALVAAIREEIGASLGGPAPRHEMLRELGYVGWSELLAYRPSVPRDGRRTPNAPTVS
jgi:hypothetical protein